VVTSLFLGSVAQGGVQAMTLTLVVILCLVGACLLAVPLLPRQAAEDV